MKCRLKVGKGFGQLSLKNALDKSKKGDVIAIHAGEYVLDEPVIVNNLTFQGLGKSPKDVIIRGDFHSNNNKIALRNLSLEGYPGKNTVNLKEKGFLEAENVIFYGQGNGYPTIYGENFSKILLHNSEIYNQFAIDLGVHISNGSSAELVSSDVQALSANSSTFKIQFSRIRNSLILTNHSETRADKIYFAEVFPEKFAMYLEEGSLFFSDYLGVPSEGFYAKITDSKVQVQESNIDKEHVVTSFKNISDEVKIPGANIELLDQQVQEKAQEGDQQVQEKNYEDSQQMQENIYEDEQQEESQDTVAPSENALMQLEQMIGIDKVKREIRKFIDLSLFSKKRVDKGLTPLNQSFHAEFLGNPGTGKTTVARLVGQIMNEEGLLPSDNYVEVTRQDLVADVVGGTAIKTQEVLNKALGGVLFIDEAYSLNQEGQTNWGQEAIDTILKYMEDHRSDLMIIFAVYTDEMQDFVEMNPGLKSRISNVFTFPDYSGEEIAEIGCRQLEKEQFHFDHEYYREEVKKAYAFDVDHGNGRWIRNLNDKLLGIVASNSLREEDRAVDKIKRSDIEELFGSDVSEKENTTLELLEQLDNLIGLLTVKTFVHQLVERVKTEQKYEKDLPDSQAPSYHMVFAGQPGTGKTTVARIVAQLFYNLGILSKGTVNEVSRKDLVGQYVGQTEEKTGKIIRNAMGGVLFVDEAYQLTQNRSENDFGKQALETFITELENDRDKFVTIFAGYTEPMQQFLDENPGLRSRVPLHIEFESYTPEQIAQIVSSSITKDWKVNTSLLEKVVINMYTALPEKKRSNARWARNYTERLISAHKVWLGKQGNIENVKEIHDSLIEESQDWVIS